MHINFINVHIKFVLFNYVMYFSGKIYFCYYGSVHFTKMFHDKALIVLCGDFFEGVKFIYFHCIEMFFWSSCMGMLKKFSDPEN